MSDAFQQELALALHRKLACLPQCPRGNSYAERFIYTLKEKLLWARTFATVEELCQALLVFRAI